MAVGDIDGAIVELTRAESSAAFGRDAVRVLTELEPVPADFFAFGEVDTARRRASIFASADEAYLGPNGEAWTQHTLSGEALKGWTRMRPGGVTTLAQLGFTPKNLRGQPLFENYFKHLDVERQLIVPYAARGTTIYSIGLSRNDPFRPSELELMRKFCHAANHIHTLRHNDEHRARFCAVTGDLVTTHRIALSHEGRVVSGTQVFLEEDWCHGLFGELPMRTAKLPPTLRSWVSRHISTRTPVCTAWGQDTLTTLSPSWPLVMLDIQRREHLPPRAYMLGLDLTRPRDAEVAKLLVRDVSAEDMPRHMRPKSNNELVTGRTAKTYLSHLYEVLGTTSSEQVDDKSRKSMARKTRGRTRARVICAMDVFIRDQGWPPGERPSLRSAAS